MVKKDKQDWTLDPETEYRFELEPDQTLAVRVRRLPKIVATAKSHC